MSQVKQFSKRSVKWEAPPEVSRGYGKQHGRYEKFFEALRENPGQWAVWPRLVKHASVASAIKAGSYMGSEPGEFEAVSRKAGNGRQRIYARYVGALDSGTPGGAQNGSQGL